MNQTSHSEKNRIQSIDLLRGLVIIIMALDHVRDYVHIGAMTGDPLNLQTTTPLLFFTRWITHYCAPIFVFLSGISAYLSGIKKSTQQLSGFLIKRGLWLLVLEVTVITFGWSFNPFFNFMVFQVIWAIGASMIALGLLIYLPRKWIMIIAILILGLHNLLDNVQFGAPGNSFVWDLLHHGHFVMYPLFANHNLVIVYPLLPWIGIIALGYSMGFLFEKHFDKKLRFKILRNTGFGMIVLFILLRLSHLYGDAQDWQTQPTFINTILSYIDVTKYPPSLLFTCMTLGPAMLFLAYIEKANSMIGQVCITFGRVPFFFYVLHIYLIHIITVILFYASGFTSADIIPEHGIFWFRPPTMGFGLPFVYLIWIGVIALLYYPCKKYDKYKTENKHWWLSYL